MSFAHEMRVLEIASQIELLDRLQLLTRFGSNLINISGAKGSGKTWLAQRYLEAWATEKNQSLLLCYPSQTDAQQRAMMLNQLVSDAMFNESDSVLDSFGLLVGDEPCDVVFVVDDAQMLTEDLLAELWMLVVEAQNHPKWSVNVVLFSEGDSLEHILARIGYGQETKPVDFEIETFTEQEAEEFTELLVVRYAQTLEGKQKIRKQAKKCQRLPGGLIALGAKKVEKRIIIRSVIESPARIAALVLVLFLLIAGGYWWFFSQETPELDSSKVMVEQSSSNQDSQMALDANNVSGANSTETVRIPSDGDRRNGTEVEADAMALPPTVMSETATVGGQLVDDEKRVIVPSDVVDALMADRDPPASVTVIDDVVADTKPAAKEQNRITFSYARDELEALSPRAYTLQLAAMTSKQEAQAFINLHQLNGQVRIYPTVRNEVEWFIITYQDYDSIQKARDAVNSLSTELQAVGPWAKSLNQVQREILRGK
ncbi:SPOR domain-containing protein [Vibrio tapetis]|uniref:SPOR domain-containing protein n=1 Tax=Vibrio tapetis subsp. tapetis TaxID=1671868 RepID=A0A2N8ZGA4_9VIBR|nr:AAA family ATPase [Vibrio tapetis]SON50928.1 conserved protein of unknown function [Vibrio tapetis subsp. tapetis]